MLDNKSSADNFADFLYFLGNLERKNSQLFEVGLIFVSYCTFILQ